MLTANNTHGAHSGSKQKSVNGCRKKKITRPETGAGVAMVSDSLRCKPAVDGHN